MVVMEGRSLLVESSSDSVRFSNKKMVTMVEDLPSATPSARVSEDSLQALWQEKQDTPEKTRRPVASSGTFPMCENLGSAAPYSPRFTLNGSQYPARAGPGQMQMSVAENSDGAAREYAAGRRTNRFPERPARRHTRVSDHACLQRIFCTRAMPSSKYLSVSSVPAPCRPPGTSACLLYPCHDVLQVPQRLFCTRAMPSSRYLSVYSVPVPCRPPGTSACLLYLRHAVLHVPQRVFCTRAMPSSRYLSLPSVPVPCRPPGTSACLLYPCHAVLQDSQSLEHEVCHGSAVHLGGHQVSCPGLQEHAGCLTAGCQSPLLADESGPELLGELVGRVEWARAARELVGRVEWAELLGELVGRVEWARAASQNAKSKYRDRIRLERASQKQSSDTHKTPYDRVKRCRERKINTKASERVNVDVFT
ncbi:hypothetical protein PR048_028427 [Dryococelus australis]|uniref:Uncharacterized protein n=1 Tax=Dryococelus australis TaxID=614101 RepID=A0ABQ9GAI5_9NEOP|nr:hypothetical protein PR048_028427 [Dryococelus australis]